MQNFVCLGPTLLVNHLESNSTKNDRTICSVLKQSLKKYLTNKQINHITIRPVEFFKKATVKICKSKGRKNETLG